MNRDFYNTYSGNIPMYPNMMMPMTFPTQNDNQYSCLNNQISNLEKRVSNLEKIIGNNYNQTSNYQVL